MKILLDNGILSHSEFAIGAELQKTILWGDTENTFSIKGIVKKETPQNTERKKQIEALFTIGRLIRESKIQPYIYSEIMAENARGRRPNQNFYALQGCNIQRCDAAIERTKFRQTINLTDYFAKGGKKDIKAKKKLGNANQIAFLSWLCGLTVTEIQLIINHALVIGLSEFEIDSFRDLERFQFLCQRSASPENYPDVFHIWTAERNKFDVFLTLDYGPSRLLDKIGNEKEKTFSMRTEALLPLELLKKMGVSPDPIPIEDNRFYHLFEICD